MSTDQLFGALESACSSFEQSANLKCCLRNAVPTAPPPTRNTLCIEAKQAALPQCGVNYEACQNLPGSAAGLDKACNCLGSYHSCFVAIVSQCNDVSLSPSINAITRSCQAISESINRQCCPGAQLTSLVGATPTPDRKSVV